MREIRTQQPGSDGLYEEFEADYKKKREEKGPLVALLELRASLSPYQNEDLPKIVKILQDHALAELDLLRDTKLDDAPNVALKKAIGGQLDDYSEGMRKWEAKRRD